MTDGLNFKELYEVSLKTTYPIEVGDNLIEIGETIAYFDRIQIANFQEIKNTANANGGWDNRSHIFWESTKEVKINFTQGVFSKTQLALMMNASFVTNDNSTILINAREEFESDEMRRVIVKNAPIEPIFVYNKDTGKKIKDWTRAGNTILVTQQYQPVIVDYWYNYENSYQTLKIGQALTHGYLSLTGKMRVKDDVTGKVTTGIIKIPKLRLMSDLSIRVGSDAIPQVGRLDAVAVPEGARGQSKVMEIIFLSDDIDADM